LLEKTRDAVDSWPVHQFDCRQLRRAVQTSYKKARRCLADARRNPSPKAFHDFRTEAKVLAHQLRILRPINPVVLKNLGDELSSVGELLGRSHDLTFLGERLHRDDWQSAWKREGQRLLAVLEVSQNDLQRAAADLAERFFSERPRDFGARLDTWLDEWAAARTQSVAEELVS